MKKGMGSLQEFAAEIERRAAAKEDLVASTKKAELVPYVRVVDDRPVGDVQMVIGGDRRYDVNKTGHSQIAEAAGIPPKYYDRMLSADQKLLCSNVNEWFQREPADKLWRTLDGNLRAVRSNSFRTDLEYEDLARAIIPTLMELDVAIMSYQLTETKMYIKVVDKRVERELKAVGGKFGDGGHNIVRCLSPALTISDSEVGYGSAAVMAGCYDGFCSNLATFGERSVRKYHAGARHAIAADADYSLLSQDTRDKTAAATAAQLRDVVAGAFDRARFDSLCDRIAETTTQPIGDDIVQVVKLTSKKLGLTEGEGTDVLRHLAAGGDLTRFGLYNAVTRMSQDVEDYDRATLLEQTGAKIIDLPKSEWREINRKRDLAEAA